MIPPWVLFQLNLKAEILSGLSMDLEKTAATPVVLLFLVVDNSTGSGSSLQYFQH